MSNQALRQASVRAATGTAYDYNGDWSALFDVAGIPAYDWNGRLLAYINLKLGTAYTEINGAMAAFAIANGAPEWNSLGTFSAALFDPAATALFARMTVQPDNTRKALINSTILGLKADGSWSHLKILCVLAAHDAQAARLNWIADEYNLQPVNSPVFTVDRGYAGDGSSAYLNTGFQPASAPSPKYTQNSGHVSAYNRTARGVAAQQILGASDGGAGAIQLASTNGTGQALYRVNDTGGGFANAVGNQGLWHADRASAGGVTLYRNGTTLTANAAASNPVVNLPVWIGAVNVNGGVVSPSNDQFGMFSLGETNGAQALSFYNTIQAYMTAVGAAV